jgi:8-oxo-dGTP pyrophosphatase MutT (NUDIX family)
MKPEAVRERLATLDARGWEAVPEPADAERPLTPAAVLVPLVTHEEGLSAIFTERTAHLHDHAGQVSFPGGRYEEADDNAVATALREAD